MTGRPPLDARRRGASRWGGGQGATQDRYDGAGARELAEALLDAFLPGAEVLAGRTYPSCVTFGYGRDGRVDGMLGVQLVSGRVWPHTWHGAFRGAAGVPTD